MRCWWCMQVGKALSRLLNAILGADHCRESWAWHHDRRLFDIEK